MTPKVFEQAAIDEIAEQRVANSEALAHYLAFANHRTQLTRLVLDRVSRQPVQRLCVLGAGNCFDLDLEAIAPYCDEVHLVDLDSEALLRTKSRQSAKVGAALTLHAPVDLSGTLSKVHRWRQLEIDPVEMVEHAALVPKQLCSELGGPFDLVLSTCLLTQMQLALLNTLGESHPLFPPARDILNLTHLRTLAGLTSPDGRALLVTDVSSSRISPLVADDTISDLPGLLSRLVAERNVIYAASPDLLQWMGREDGILSSTVELSRPLDVWRWSNGPGHIFLVYAVELRPRDSHGARETLVKGVS